MSETFPVPPSGASPPTPPAGLPLPGDFVGPELARSPDTFVHELPLPVRAGLRGLLATIERGQEGPEIERGVREVLADATRRTLTALTSGPGLILLRGVPVEGRPRDAVAALYAMMGRAIGQPVPQNLDGERMTDVRDTGADPSDPEVRLYRTRAEQDFHTDGADVIGLLCLRGAKAGGESRLVSSVRVYRKVCEARPDLAPLLFEPWFFHLPGGKARGLPEALPRPIAAFDGRKLETFFIGWYLRNAQAFDGVPRFDHARRELLELYEAAANDPSLALDMHFRPGDVQWLRNAFVLHKRTAYEDHPEPERKRHLLRLWLSVEGIDDATPRFSPEGGAPS
ncbi:MAG TPA: TauD/TfdA family dioxygenase [Polyangiaceae bacterium]|nr:TauD/TfdA family dioxygenase [Polyangiaceae bacterium]